MAPKAKAVATSGRGRGRGGRGRGLGLDHDEAGIPNANHEPEILVTTKGMEVLKMISSGEKEQVPTNGSY